MGLVSPSQSNAGEIITAGAINNPINQLASVINGNIDANNVLDGSITATKLTANIPITKFSNPHKFRAFRNGAGNVAGGGDTVIIMDSENYDTGANYDQTNGRFTAPVAGFYQFTAGTTVGVVAGDFYTVKLFKNGTLASQGNAGVAYVSFTHTYVVTDMLQLGIGDYIDVRFQNGNATARAISVGTGLTYFTGHLVSTT